MDDQDRLSYCPIPFGCTGTVEDGMIVHEGDDICPVHERDNEEV